GQVLLDAEEEFLGAASAACIFGGIAFGLGGFVELAFAVIFLKAGGLGGFAFWFGAGSGHGANLQREGDGSQRARGRGTEWNKTGHLLGLFIKLLLKKYKHLIFKMLWRLSGISSGRVVFQHGRVWMMEQRIDVWEHLG